MKSKGITVVGNGEASAPPDLMSVDIGVSVRTDTVSVGSAAAATSAGALIGALLESGVDRSDIGTTDYSISSEYEWSGSQRTFLGYRVSNTVRVKIRNLDNAGTIIDRAVTAGGNDIEIRNLGFFVEDPTTLSVEARQAAWEDAVAKATQLAQLAGRTLGKAVSIIEGAPQATPIRGARMELAMDTASTPIEGGTSVVGVTLTVRFELSD